MRARLLAAAFATIAASVLLTSCSANPIAGGGCNVSVDTADLIQQRRAAHIPDCPTDTGSSDLPDVSVACLGSTRKVSLAHIKGPAILNFWSSNCGPCRKEMPALAAFAKQYAGQVTVFGIDFLDTYPGAGLDLAKQSGVTYPLLADECGDLEQSSLAAPTALPFFYFVRADGSVSKPTFGGLDSVQQVADLAEKNGIALKAAG